MRYSTIAEPPFDDGAFHDSDTVVLPIVAASANGSALGGGSTGALSGAGAGSAMQAQQGPSSDWSMPANAPENAALKNLRWRGIGPANPGGRIAVVAGIPGKPDTFYVAGAAGGIIVLLLWVYYSAQIFLLGAEFTKVWANHYGSQRHD